MTNERFFDRERLPLPKKKKDNLKKKSLYHSYPQEHQDYDIGDLFSDLGNQVIANFFESILIQPKLNVSQPGDIYEQEADRIANEVVKGNTGKKEKVKVTRLKKKTGSKKLSVSKNIESKIKNLKGKGNPLDKSIMDLINSRFDDVLDDTRAHTGVNPLSGFALKANANNKTISDKSEAKIKDLKGKGNPLSKSVRDYFEPRFGVDFGDVRVHTGKEQNLLAEYIHAKAFTKGKDIVFGEGQYQPATTEGKKLIAHELTHTLQQGEVSEVVMRKEGVKERTEDYKLNYSSFEELKKKFDEIYKYLKNKYKNVDNKPNTLLYMTGTFEYENVGLTFFTEKGWNFLMNDVDLKGNFDESTMSNLKQIGGSEDMKEMRGYLQGFIENHPGKTCYTWNYKDLKNTLGKAKFDDMLKNDKETLISLIEEKMPDDYKKTPINAVRKNKVNNIIKNTVVRYLDLGDYKNHYFDGEKWQSMTERFLALDIHLRELISKATRQHLILLVYDGGDTQKSRDKASEIIKNSLTQNSDADWMNADIKDAGMIIATGHSHGGSGWYKALGKYGKEIKEAIGRNIDELNTYGTSFRWDYQLNKNSQVNEVNSFFSYWDKVMASEYNKGLLIPYLLATLLTFSPLFILALFNTIPYTRDKGGDEGFKGRIRNINLSIMKICHTAKNREGSITDGYITERGFYSAMVALWDSLSTEEQERLKKM